MGIKHRADWTICILFSLTALPRVATAALQAADRESVRVLANDAIADYDAGRTEQALAKFQRAYDTVKVPTLCVWLAKTRIKLGQLVSAAELLREAIRLERNELWTGIAQQDAQKQAVSDLAQLQPRIPRVVVRIEGADATDVTVEIDDVRLPNTLLGVDRLVDPGQRKIVGRAGGLIAQVRVQLVEAERKEVILKFPRRAEVGPSSGVAAPNQPKAAPMTHAPSPTASGASAQRTWGWISVTVGAAGLLVGATAGVIVAVKHGKLSDQCPAANCGSAYWSDVDNYHLWRSVSTAGFIVGAVGTVTGVTLLLTSPKRESTPQVGLFVAPTSAGLQGEF